MNLKGKNIAVTGATGFLGRYIVETLQERGAHVIGVVRNPDKVPELKAQGVELRKADLAEKDRLAEAFRGTDAVVSNAALFNISNQKWEDHLKANIDGTRNVFEAVKDSGVNRVVHVSSVAVYSGHKKPVTEDHPQFTEKSRKSRLTVYPISKALSEQLAWKLAGTNSLELTTVRPSAIYGAFDTNFTPWIRRLMKLPVAPSPAGLIFPLVYAGDVAEAIARVLEKPDVSTGKAYNISGDRISMSEFLKAWKSAGGKSSWATIPVPVPIDRYFEIERASHDLGWSNRSFTEGLRDTFAREGMK